LRIARFPVSAFLMAARKIMRPGEQLETCLTRTCGCIIGNSNCHEGCWAKVASYCECEERRWVPWVSWNETNRRLSLGRPAA
jgi:hypothetical protein